jgi:hypothetical protein
MRYTTREGLPLEGGTPVEIIESLRSYSRTPSRDRTEYLGQLASAATLQTGKRVRSTDCATTLADLSPRGWLSARTEPGAAGRSG